MRKELSPSEYDKLPYEVIEKVHNPFSKEFTVEACNNCGNLISPIASQKDALPPGVSHAHTYLKHATTYMELCNNCDDVLKKEVEGIHEKFTRGNTSLNK